MRPLVCLLACVGLTAVLALPVQGVTVQGTLLYEKIPATAHGLDLPHPVEMPVARVTLALLTPDQKQVVARGSTDDDGSYRFEIPNDTGPVSLYVLAESGNTRVVDPSTNQVYGGAFTAFDAAEWPKRRVIPDAGRSSGPFNILAVLRRANRLMEQIDLSFLLAEPPLTVYWSPTREPGSYRSGSALSLNGLRDQDSDEFDDSVILRLYGGYLLERFARPTGPGGGYRLGDRLDPRLAWSEGWSYFFAQAVLDTPVYLDTAGASGQDTVALDLEQDVLRGEDAGYWSIHSVATALWDLFAEASLGSGHLGLGLGPIWRMVREEFSRQGFAYLITLADGLIRQDRSRESGVTTILAKRGIDYQFENLPPVLVPFPRRIASGVPETGSVDSLTSGRINLLGAADYFFVDTDGARPLHLRLTVTGEPSPGAGLIHLVVYNAGGYLIKAAESWLWGTGDQAELALPLPADRYVIGVLSYALAQPQAVLGSAHYQLTAEY